MPDRPHLAELIAYNDWADREILSALRELSAGEWSHAVGGSFGSIQATAAHLVGAEWIWLQRWRGTSPSGAPDWLRAPSPADLSARWEEIAEERDRWFRTVGDDELGRDLSYRLLGGEPQATRLDVLVRHVVNHSSYHRGQIAAFLRSLGKAPPPTDLVLWDRQRREPTSTDGLQGASRT